MISQVPPSMTTDSIISVLIPTRQRPGALERSISSLRDQAHMPDLIEFCVAVDPDDSIPVIPGIKLHIPSHRYGYGLLHEYYNDLARISSGDWLFIWNDDAIMLTSGWDTFIRKQPPALLWSYVPEALGMNVFPVVPAAWAQHLGHLSLNHSIDMWLIDVGEQLNRRVHHIPVTVSHQKMEDSTAHERNMSANISSFHSEDNITARQEDAKSINQLLGDVPGNSRLVSVILPDLGSSLPQIIDDFINTADDPEETEFLVSGGSRNCIIRKELELHGLMGITEVHTASDLDEVRKWAHGTWIVGWENINRIPGWDNEIRDTNPGEG